jgi:uncharacterized membrane protein YdbT with pleckstrin-like domain
MTLFSFLKQTQYSFEDKKPYEKVLTLLYRHWFVLVPQSLMFLIMALLPGVLYAFVVRYLEQAHLVGLFWFFIAIYYLVWWYGIFYMITMYLLDIWIVTDHRVVDTEQHGLFNHTVTELTLSKIQDVSVRIKGGLPTFLDYGDLEIETAGAERRLVVFKQIPHPTKIKDLIMQAHYDYMETHPNDTEPHDHDGV